MQADRQSALIVFAHGSRIGEANEAVRQVAEEAAQRCGFALWDAAFLELATPDLETAVRGLIQRGAGSIVVTPYFLTMGVHLQQDLPRLLESITGRYDGVELLCAPPLAGHPGLVEILSDRARQTIKR